MEVKIYKNDYGHDSIDCPFCGERCYARPATKVSPDRLRDLKRHILNRAKAEALDWILNDPSKQVTNREMGSHLKYVKDHLREKPPQLTTGKYLWDGDLK